MDPAVFALYGVWTLAPACRAALRVSRRRWAARPFQPPSLESELPHAAVLHVLAALRVGTPANSSADSALGGKILGAGSTCVQPVTRAAPARKTAPKPARFPRYSSLFHPEIAARKAPPYSANLPHLAQLNANVLTVRHEFAHRRIDGSTANRCAALSLVFPNRYQQTALAPLHCLLVRGKQHIQPVALDRPATI